MRVVQTALLVATLAAALWFAGEKHRENCLREGRTGCSVLPWEDGRPPEELTREELERMLRDIEGAPPPRGYVVPEPEDDR